MDAVILSGRFFFAIAVVVLVVVVVSPAAVRVRVLRRHGLPSFARAETTVDDGASQADFYSSIYFKIRVLP